jgi:hypothetical protein
VVRKANATKGKIRIHTPNVEITKACTFDTAERQKYFLHHRVFHYVERQTLKLITIQIPEIQPWRSASGLIVDDRIELNSPFNKPKTQDECWEIIEYTLS